ncbi:MAG: T9SS type A sorting domain-containing protein [Bacteroidales bacterium]
MNHTYAILLAAIIFCTTAAKAQNVPNADFENWTLDTLFEDPSGYVSINMQAIAMGGNPVVEKSTDSYSGNYAAKLTTRTAEGDAIPGILGTSTIDDLQGIPYTETPDSISMYVKENLSTGDTASGIFLFTYMANPVGMAEFTFTDSATSYQRYQNPVTWFAPGVQPDSVIIMLTSSTLMDNGIPGSNITIDNISFGSGYSNPPNHDFENWDSFETEDPDDWFTFNFFMDPSSPSVEKSTDSYSGNFAAKITNALTLSDDTMGLLTNGRIGSDGPAGGYYVWKNPDVISGYYKYIPDGPDTALVGVFTYAWSDSANHVIMVDSSLLKLPPANNYTLFEVNMDYNGWPVTDTLNITFAAGNYLDETGQGHIGLGSELFIDDLNVNFKPLSAKKQKGNKFKLWPNPASDYVQAVFRDNQFENLKIYSLDGRLLKHIDISQKQNLSLNTSAFPRGMILLEFTGRTETITQKLILQ